MKKSWGLIGKIISGEKKIESRWYKSKRSPWGKIEKGDTVYFKDSGEPVSIKAKVKKVISFSDFLYTTKKRSSLSAKNTRMGCCFSLDRIS